MTSGQAPDAGARKQLAPISGLDDVLGRMIAQQLHNACREADNPSTTYCIRWIWELSQNARDSIAGSDRESVSIIITISDNEVVFQHDGNPFTYNALVGLFLKASVGKERMDTTGRFGTGFVTTIVLGHTIAVESDVIEEDDHGQATVIGFKTTMYRDGDVNALQDGIKKTWNDMELTSPIGRTTFRYPLQGNSTAEKARDLGIRSYEMCIAEALLFVSKIAKWTILDKRHGQNTLYEACCGESKQVDDSGLRLETSVLTLNGEKHERKFLVKSTPLTSDAEQSEANCLCISVAVEVDQENQLICTVNMERPCFFCAFPLIGSEHRRTPYILNSRDLEPTTERDDIHLGAVNDRSRTAAKNRLILLQSIELFDAIVSVLVKWEFGGFYNLLGGISPEVEISSKDSDLADQWYKVEYIDKVRCLLEKYRLVKNVRGDRITIKEAFFPIYQDASKEQNCREMHNLVVARFGHNTVDFLDSLHWKIWMNCIGINKLVEDIDANAQHAELDFEYMNMLLAYIEKYNLLHLLGDHCIIPNMRMRLKKYEAKLCHCRNVRPELIELLNDMKSSWESDHVHNNITGLTILNEHDETVAYKAILDLTNGEAAYYHLVRRVYGPCDGHRRKMLDFVRRIIPKQYASPTIEVADDHDRKLWWKCDEFFIDKIKSIIKSMQRSEVLENIQLIGEFLRFLQSEDTTCLDNDEIVPNFYGDFQRLSNMTVHGTSEDDNIIPESLRNVLRSYLEIDIYRNEIHPDVAVLVDCQRFTNISTYIPDIQEKFGLSNEESKNKVSSVIVSMRPRDKTSSLHQKLSDLFQIHSDLFGEQTQCESSYCSEDLWKSSNDYIAGRVLRELEKTKTTDTFMCDHQCSAEAMIRTLNICYNYISTGKCVPNMNGVLCNASDLRSSDPFSDDVIRIASVGNPKLKETLVHRGIVHGLIGSYTFDEIRTMIDNAQTEIEKNPEVRNDPEISAVFTRFQTRTDLSDLEKEIYQNATIANITQVLEKVRHPPSSSFKERWIWELIQNACDSCFGRPQKAVDIIIRCTPDRLEFIHNGGCFTLFTRAALIFKYTYKEMNRNVTGKFGSGFMITNMLSLLVYLTGDILINDGTIHGQMNGFSATIDRRGESRSELIESLDNTKKSVKDFPTTFGRTEFNYDLSINKDGVCVMEAGIESLKRNICQVMAFRDTIGTVTLHYNGRIEEYIREDVSPSEIVIHKIVNKNTRESRKFIFVTKAVPFPEEFRRQGESADPIHVTCLLEIDENDCLVKKRKHSESIHCGFPLVGSTGIVTQMTTNSVDFQPNEDRDALYLKEDQSRESGINYVILSTAVECFEELVNICMKRNIGKLYHLVHGLSEVIYERHMEKKLYERLILYPMRKIVGQSAIFRTDNGVCAANDVSIPVYRKFAHTFKDNPERFDKFCRQFYSVLQEWYPNLVVYEDSLKWSGRLWHTFPRETYEKLESSGDNLSANSCTVDIETLVKKVADEKTLTVGDDRDMQRMNMLLDFLIEYDKEKLEKFAVIPDQNGCFRIGNVETLARDTLVGDDLVEMLEYLGVNWKGRHVNKSISGIVVPVDHDIDTASVELMKLREESCIKMMRYTPNGDNEDRQKMLDIARTVFPEEDLPEHVVCISGLHKRLWNDADKCVRKRILDKIQSLDFVSEILIEGDKVEWLNELFIFMDSVGAGNEFKCMKLIPNASGAFCLLSNLKKDEIGDIELKKCLEAAGIHVDDVTIDSRITAVEISESIQFMTYSNEISVDRILREFADVLIRYVDKKDIDEIPVHAKVLSAYNLLFKTRHDQKAITGFVTGTVYCKIRNICVSNLKERLMDFENIEEMQAELGVANEIFDILNLIYRYVDRECLNDLKVPNFHGEFRDKKDLVRHQLSPNSEILLGVEKIITPEVDSERSFVHPAITTIEFNKTVSENDIALQLDRYIYEFHGNLNGVEVPEVYQNGIRVLWNQYFSQDEDEKWKQFPQVALIKDRIFCSIVWTKFHCDIFKWMNGLNSEEQEELANGTSKEYIEWLRWRRKPTEYIDTSAFDRETQYIAVFILYQSLKECRGIESVELTAQSESPTNLCITRNGEQCYIKDETSQSDFDVIARARNGEYHYFEVLSRAYMSSFSISISRHKLEEPANAGQKWLALVAGVRTEHHIMRLLPWIEPHEAIVKRLNDAH